jgi:hypothetical protein
MSDVDTDPFIGLDGLVGSQLACVIFIWDYQQIECEGPRAGEIHRINIYGRPHVRVGDRWYMSGEPGYRDALCDRIGAVVRGAQTAAEEERIAIDLADGALISISLRQEDTPGPEAAEYVRTFGRQTERHMVWQDNWKDGKQTSTE